MLDERPDECHLLAGVVEDDFRIGGDTAQAVGCHDHGQIAGIHFGDGRHFRLRKNLQNKFRRQKKKNEKSYTNAQTWRKRMR